MTGDPAPVLRVVIVGAGPRGTGVLERLLANAGDLLDGQCLHIDVVDPYPPGGGRVWRADQSGLMWMNATAENITMFPDDTVRCEGPIRPGPSLTEWSAGRGDRFASRQEQQRYLAWFFDRVVAERPPNVTVETHLAVATRLDEGSGGGQRVWLAGQPEPLAADVVILAMGHLDAAPSAPERELTAFADRHRLAYLPRAYSADADLSRFRPGEPVVLRGFGLAFIDLMVLLTEARGGRYQEIGPDELK
ncbi:MAG: FAD/NAD(P)-binding protein, partial [Catenulispora sp.]